VVRQADAGEPDPDRVRRRRTGNRSPRRRLAIAAAAAAAAAIAVAAALLIGNSGSSSTPTTTPQRATDPPWGFTGSWRDYCYRTLAAPPGYATRVISPSQQCLGDSRRFTMAQQLALTARAGASIDRLAVHWGAVEPTPPRRVAGARVHAFEWAPIARIYNAMLADGIQPVGLVYGAPEWARQRGWSRPGVCDTSHGKVCAYPPSRGHLSDWRAFVGALIRRFPKMLALEIWNEPNLPRFFAPRPSPRLYSSLLENAHRAAETAGTSVPIVSAGLSVGASGVNGGIGAATFLTSVYRQAGKASFDGIGAHPYPHGVPRVANMTANLDRMRRVRDRFGDRGTPLWVTEVGVGGTAEPHGELSVSPAAQGPMLARMYRSTRGNDVRAFIIYALRDSPIEGPKFEPFGVVRATLQPKPAYCYLARRLGGVRLCGG
jgi:polysaccharide biosynthesis protein PslG